MPVFILFLLCFIQVVLVMHAKFLVDYAAFASVRAGIVNRGDMDEMKNAAATVLAPLFSNSVLGTLSPNIVSLGTMKEYVKLRISEDPDSSDLVFPVKLSILNNPSPVPEYNAQISTFRLSQEQKNLKIKVEYAFPLTVPLANRILDQLKRGLYGDDSTLSGKFLLAEEVLPPITNPTLKLSSTCAMRLTTLTNKAGS